MSDDDIPLVFDYPPGDRPHRNRSKRVQRAELRAFLDEVTRRVTRGRTIVCLVTTDARLRRLNRRFRGKNSATDVLSFPADGGNGLAGDLAISLDRAARQAAEHGHSLEQELRILMLHGALHLAGMDHETDGGQMARAETRWRRKLGLPCGLIERAAV